MGDAELIPELRALIAEDVGDVEHQVLEWALGVGYDGSRFRTTFYYRALTVEGVEQSATVDVYGLEPDWKVEVG